jgi:hypothetical protein
MSPGHPSYSYGEGNGQSDRETFRHRGYCCTDSGHEHVPDAFSNQYTHHEKNKTRGQNNESNSVREALEFFLERSPPHFGLLNLSRNSAKDRP